jgi:predicted transcriptional regulator
MVKRYNMSLSRDLSTKLDLIAKAKGISPTSLCSFAVAQYIDKTIDNLANTLLENPELRKEILSKIDK